MLTESADKSQDGNTGAKMIDRILDKVLTEKRINFYIIGLQVVIFTGVITWCFLYLNTYGAY